MARSMMLELKTKDKSGKKRFSVDDIKKLHFLYKTVINLLPENNGCLILKKNAKGYFLEVKIDGGNIQKDVHLGPLKGSSIVSLRDKIRDAIDKYKIVLRSEKDDAVNIPSKSLDDYNFDDQISDKKKEKELTIDELIANFTPEEKYNYERYIERPQSFYSNPMFDSFKKRIFSDPDCANIRTVFRREQEWVEELERKYAKRKPPEKLEKLEKPEKPKKFLGFLPFSFKKVEEVEVKRENSDKPEILLRTSSVQNVIRPYNINRVLDGVKPYLRMFVPCPSCGNVITKDEIFPTEKNDDSNFRLTCECGQKLRYAMPM